MLVEQRSDADDQAMQTKQVTDTDRAISERLSAIRVARGVSEKAVGEAMGLSLSGANKLFTSGSRWTLNFLAACRAIDADPLVTLAEAGLVELDSEAVIVADPVMRRHPVEQAIAVLAVRQARQADAAMAAPAPTPKSGRGAAAAPLPPGRRVGRASRG